MTEQAVYTDLDVPGGSQQQSGSHATPSVSYPLDPLLHSQYLMPLLGPQPQYTSAAVPANQISQPGYTDMTSTLGPSRLIQKNNSSADIVYDANSAPPVPQQKQQQPQRERLSYTRYQLELLNGIYQEIQYPNNPQKQLIAKRVGISREQIKIWFQNRRRKDVIGRSDPKVRESLQKIESVTMVPSPILSGIISELQACNENTKGNKLPKTATKYTNQKRQDDPELTKQTQHNAYPETFSSVVKDLTEHRPTDTTVVSNEECPSNCAAGNTDKWPSVLPVSSAPSKRKASPEPDHDPEPRKRTRPDSGSDPYPESDLDSGSRLEICYSSDSRDSLHSTSPNSAQEPFPADVTDMTSQTGDSQTRSDSSTPSPSHSDQPISSPRPRHDDIPPNKVAPPSKPIPLSALFQTSPRPLTVHIPYSQIKHPLQTNTAPEAYRDSLLIPATGTADPDPRRDDPETRTVDQNPVNPHLFTPYSMPQSGIRTDSSLHCYPPSGYGYVTQPPVMTSAPVPPGMSLAIPDPLKMTWSAPDPVRMTSSSTLEPHMTSSLYGLPSAGQPSDSGVPDYLRLSNGFLPPWGLHPYLNPQYMNAPSLHGNAGVKGHVFP